MSEFSAETASIDLQTLSDDELNALIERAREILQNRRETQRKEAIDEIHEDRMIENGFDPEVDEPVFPFATRTDWSENPEIVLVGPVDIKSGTFHLISSLLIDNKEEKEYHSTIINNKEI